MINPAIAPKIKKNIIFINKDKIVHFDATWKLPQDPVKTLSIPKIIKGNQCANNLNSPCMMCNKRVID